MAQTESDPSFAEIARIAHQSKGPQLKKEIKPKLLQIYDNDFIIDYALKMVVRWAETTTKSNLGVLKEFESHLDDESVSIDEVSGRNMREYADSLAFRGNLVCTIDRKLSTISYLYSHLENEMGIDPPEISVEGSHYEARVPEETERKAISKQKVRKVIQAADNLRDTLIIAMFYYTGIRREELQQCNVEDINREQRILRVRSGKGNKSRKVPYKSELDHLLTRWIDIKRPIYPESDDPALFLSDNGGESAGRLGYRQYYQKFMDAVDDAGVQEVVGETSDGRSKYRVTPHVMRHSVATHMVEDGVPLKYIQRILGHESIETTLRYAKESEYRVYDSYHNEFDGI